MRGRAWAAAALMLLGAASGQDYAPSEQRQSPVPAAETGDYTGIRTLAIVSALGPEFHIASSSGQSVHTIDVSGWRADALIAATLRRYLAGRFDLVEPAIEGAALRALPEFMRETRTLDWLRSRPGAAVDAYLLVRPVGDPTPGPAGIGIRLGTPTALCANFEIGMIDARRWRYLGKAISRMQNHRGTPAYFACTSQDAKAATDMMRGASAETRDELQAQLRVLLPRSVVETLRALQLPVALPPPGDHSIAPPENPLDTGGIASVAVVSAIGDTFAFSSPGDALHQKSTVETPITGWDAQVERIAATALARKFSVRSGTFDREALAHVVLREHRIPRIEGLKPSAEVDSYVLILKAFREGTGTSGLGLWKREWMGRSTWACANYAVIVVDARTLKVLKAALPVMEPRSDVAFPLVAVDPALWPEGAKDAAGAAASRPVIERLIAGSLPETLYQMGMTAD